MKNLICLYHGKDGSFRYKHSTHKEKGVSYKPHNHKGYEIFILLSGEGVFMIEGTGYPLKPMDIIITKSDEIHEINYDRDTEYNRVVIHLEDDFFEKFNCTHYTVIFNNRKSGENNLLDAESAKKSGFFDTLHRLEKYILENDRTYEAVICACIVELLHQLNNSKTAGGQIISDAVKNIIDYINANIREPLLLSNLADRFFMSKYHLCRSFKKYTGFTINQYITYRRIMLVRDLHSTGKSLSAASSEAGFLNYSSFYKAYVKETGHAPSEDIKNKKI